MDDIEGGRGSQAVPGEVTRLIGVYNANGGFRGELSYVWGSMRGTAHCSLCDITHSRLRKRHAWTELVRTLGVPFDLLHLNERSPLIAEVTGSRVPCVMAQVSGAADPGFIEVFDSAALEAMSGDLEVFAAALDASLLRLSLQLPG